MFYIEPVYDLDPAHISINRVRCFTPLPVCLGARPIKVSVVARGLNFLCYGPAAGVQSRRKLRESKDDRELERGD